MLRRTGAIFRKEFGGYFSTPAGYIYLFLFLVISMGFFFGGQDFFTRNQASMRGYFLFLPTMFLFFIPAVAMRLWAEERARGTQEILLTLPVTDLEVIVGKFLAAVAFIGVALVLSLSLPVTLSFIGRPDWGPIIGGYLGAVLMGSAFLSIGIYMSAVNSNQMMAFLGALVVSALFMLVSAEFLTQHLPESIRRFSQYFGMGYHFANIGKGVVDLRDVLYYVSIIVFFLFMTVRAVQSRRWA
ncbi:MAG: hypothetical protein GEEBNDBF_00306 [bacterium]|nr:hypothetical protein [bacterium]